VVGPQAERETVRVAREEGRLSERRACGLIGMSRGSWRYQRRERDEAELRDRLRELAGERPRIGYRRAFGSFPCPRVSPELAQPVFVSSTRASHLHAGEAKGAILR
jgi:hypothetical protein